MNAGDYLRLGATARLNFCALRRPARFLNVCFLPPAHHTASTPTPNSRSHNLAPLNG